MSSSSTHKTRRKKKQVKVSNGLNQKNKNRITKRGKGERERETKMPKTGGELQTIVEAEAELRALSNLSGSSQSDYSYQILALSLLWSLPFLWAFVSHGLAWAILRVLYLGQSTESSEYSERKDKWHRRVAWGNSILVGAVSGITLICIALLKSPGKDSFACVQWATIGGLTLATSMSTLVEHTPKYSGTTIADRAESLKHLGCKLIHILRVLIAVNFMFLAPDSAKFHQLYLGAAVLLFLSLGIVIIHDYGNGKDGKEGKHGLKLVGEIFLSIPAVLLILINGILQSQSVVLPSFFIPYGDPSRDDLRTFILPLSWIAACFVGAVAVVAVFLGYCYPALTSLASGKEYASTRSDSYASTAAAHIHRPAATSHHHHHGGYGGSHRASGL